MKRAVVVALLAGCFQSTSYEGDPCPTGVCPSGLACVAGTCQSGADPDGAVPDGGGVDSGPPGCASDDDCGSAAVCHERLGTCVDDADATFYSPTGTATSGCTRAAPCTIEVLRDSQHSSTGGGFFVLEAGTYPAEDRIQLAGGATFILSGPKRGADGAVLPMTLITGSASTVEVEGVTFQPSSQGLSLRGVTTLSHVRVTGAAVPTAVTVQGFPTTILDSEIDANQGVGLQTQSGVTAGGAIDVERTKLLGNGGSAIMLASGTATLVNDLVAGNGAMTANAGGLFVEAATAVSVDFSTFADNAGVGASEILCEGVMVTLTNSILADTSSSPMTNDNCTSESYTLRSRTAAATVDPEFAGNGNYHLMAGSPARGAADPTATNPVDLDGVSRPAGHADQGAYQFTTGSTTRAAGR